MRHRFSICATVLLPMLLPFAAAAAETEAPAEADAPRGEAYFHFLKARSRERVGDLEGAAKEYRATLQKDPDSISVRVSFAMLLADGHRMAESMDMLRQALRMDPAHVPARRLMAMVLLRLRGEPRGDAYEREVRVAFEELVRVAPDDAEARRVAGKLALEANDPAAARGHFEKLLEIEPGDIEGRVLLAKALFAMREYGKAADIYEELEKDAEGSDLPERERSGQVLSYLFAERFDDALRVAEEGLKRTGEDAPEHLRFLKLKGYAAEGLGDVHAAAEALTRVLRIDPADREARFRLAQVQMRRRDFPAALDELTQVKKEMDESPQGPEMDPPYVQVLLELGTVHLEEKRYREAAAALEEALRLVGPRDRMRPAIADKLARALHGAGDTARAATVLSEAMAAMPDVTGLMLDLAELRLRGGEVKEGERLVERFVDEATPERRKEALLLAADLHARLERFDDALRLARTAAKESPGDEDALFLLGSVLERRGDDAEAEAAFKKIIAQNPSSDRTLNYLGYMLADRGDRLAEALGYIEKAVAIESRNGAYLDSLGWVLFRLGRLEEARRSLEAAIDQLVDDPVVHDHLAQVHYGLGNDDAAVAAWQRAIELGAEKPEAIRSRIEEARARRTSQGR